MTSTPVRTTTPASSATATSASASRAAPPTGTGMPLVWAAIASSIAGGVLPAPSTATSAWVALAANSIRAASPANSWATYASTGSSSVRAVRSAPRTPDRARKRARGSGAPSGPSIAPYRSRPTDSHHATRRSQASPSAPRPAAVSPASAAITAAGTAGSHSALTGTPVRAHSTRRSRPSSRSTGLVCSTP